MTPDDVCEKYFRPGLKIKVTEAEDTIIIEGTREALLFLSELFAAQAEAADDGFQISPFGGGRGWFASGSTKGIYISRIE